MESSFHGRLAEKPTSNLIREIAEGHLSGLLRLCHEETVKAIFFEEGAPVFAASNLPTEQLEHKLLLSGAVDADLIEEARRRSLTPEGLGWALVEVGAISQLSMDWSIHELATEIILSVFEWENGSYTFYEDSGLDLGTRLDWPPPECVLAGARRAARNDSIANAGAPPHRLVSPTSLGGPSSFGGLSTLNSVEGFVLSAVTSPTQVCEISSLTGLPDSDARSAVFVLLALGLLQLEEETQTASVRQTESENQTASETQIASETQVASESETQATETRIATETQPIETQIAETQVDSQTQIPSDTEAATETLFATETQVDSETPLDTQTRIASDTPIAAHTLFAADTQVDSEMHLATETRSASESLIASETRYAGESEVANESLFASDSLLAGETLFAGEAQIGRESQIETDTQVVAESMPAGESKIDGDSHIAAETQLATEDLIADEIQVASETRIAGETPVASDSQIAGDSQIASETPFEPAKPRPPGPQESLLPGFDSGRYGGASLDWVLDVVGRKLTFMESANYYEQLGVDRIVPTSRITDAYQQLRERFESFKSRWPENDELAQQVDALLAKMEQAYVTLSDPEKRSVYDRPPNANAKAPKRTSTVKPVSVTPPQARSRSDSKDSKPLVPLSGTGFDVASTPRSDVARVRADHVFDPVAMAEQQYNRGRDHFDRRDFHSAVHLFREAAKLDASQSRYHFYLGITLSVLSQARQAHKEHAHDKGCHVTCSLGGGLIRNQRIRREAEQHMLRAAELDRLNAEVRLRLALLYKDAGMEKKAQHYFLETLMLDANNLIAQRELGIEQRSLPY